MSACKLDTCKHTQAERILGLFLGGHLVGSHSRRLSAAMFNTIRSVPQRDPEPLRIVAERLRVRQPRSP